MQHLLFSMKIPGVEDRSARCMVLGVWCLAIASIFWMCTIKQLLNWKYKNIWFNDFLIFLLNWYFHDFMHFLLPISLTLSLFHSFTPLCFPCISAIESVSNDAYLKRSLSFSHTLFFILPDCMQMHAKDFHLKTLRGTGKKM